MDISIVGKNSIKLKGRLAAFIVDPSSVLPKTQADAIILLNGINNIDTGRVIETRLIINGAGGYEVGGVKISGAATPKGILYKLSIDDVSIIVGRTTETKAEGFNSCQVAIVNTDNDFDASFVTALEPRITVLYGEKKAEAAKTLGAESVGPVSKITIAKDKLPEKMEVVVLN